MDKADIEQGLLKSAIDHLTLRGVHISDTLRDQFAAASRRGALDIVILPASDQSHEYEKAQVNIRHFVDTMVDLSSRNRSLVPSSSDEWFDNAKHVLCPIWPICD